MFSFNIFAPALSSSSTLLTFQASSDSPASYQIRLQGTGLSFNAETGTLAGNVFKVLLWDGATNTVVQTMNVSSPTTLVSRINGLLQPAASFATIASTWFQSAPAQVQDQVVFTSTSVTLPMLDSANQLMGYIKLNGTNLDSAHIDTLGRVTSIVHEDLSHNAVAGHVINYSGTGLSTLPIQYGLLRLTDGNSGNSDIINAPLTGGSDQFIATGKPGAIDGGAGNDTYVLGSFQNIIIDSAGIDTVTSTISRQLTSSFLTSIENLTLLGNATHGTGNALSNKITGNIAANVLSGLNGSDVLSGLANNDTLSGGAGRDTLTGGAGRDVMTGGADADRFIFNSVSEMGKTATTRDIIKDFTHTSSATPALSERIDLSAIDANGAAAELAAFKFLATKGAAFTGVAGQLRWFQFDSSSSALDKTIVEGDIDGNKTADFQIELSGLKIMIVTDFFL